MLFPSLYLANIIFENIVLLGKRIEYFAKASEKDITLSDS
ncbi:MAG: hypothetical protein PWQ49_729 [Methanohalophilus sp.]|nr:hypothetical protein [Methanohalophilus sp.]